MNAVPAHRETSNIVQADATSLMTVITRAASDPNTDVDKLERLMSMYERITANQAEQAFNEAMNAAQKEMPRVRRNRRNTQTSSQYADLEAIDKAIRPIIVAHGFTPSFGTDNCPLEGHYRVTCRLAHTGGHSRDYHADIPSDMNGMKGTANKTATHGFGSTISYGRRYLTMLIFNIATTDDDDGNAAGGGMITPEQVEQLREALEETGSDVRKFCEFAKVEALAEIKANQFARLLAVVNNKRSRA